MYSRQRFGIDKLMVQRVVEVWASLRQLQSIDVRSSGLLWK